MEAPSDRSIANTSNEGSMPQRESGGCILVPLFDEGDTERVLRIAASLAQQRRIELVILKSVAIPRTLPLSTSERIVEPYRERVNDAVRRTKKLGVASRGTIHVGRDVANIVLGAIDEYGSGTIILEKPRYSRPVSLLRRTPADRIMSRTDSNVLAVTTDPTRTEVTSVLLPIAGWPYSQFTTSIARAVATERKSVVDIVRIIKETASDEEREQAWEDVTACIDCLSDVDQITIRMPEKNRVARTIIEQSTNYDLTVLGAPNTRRLQEYISGSVPQTVSKDAQNTVLTAKHDRSGRSGLIS